MKKLLFEKVFEKAKKASGKTSKNGLSVFLSFKITEDFNFKIANRTLVRYYEKYVEGNGNIGYEPRTDLLDAIARYLEYKNFESFVLDNTIGKSDIKITESEEIKKLSKNKEGNKNFVSFINEKKTTIGLILIVTLLSYLGYEMTKKECMVWKIDRYKRIKCETETEVNFVKYNEVIFKNLKKVNPNCDYYFFKPDGSENLWYGKSMKGELEFFTHYGLHPNTGETLDPITQYMIDKYICIDSALTN